LLIGNRVGGWYNQEENISITRQEYREAYELHKQGKLKIITFVRQDVWQHCEEGKELAKFLKKSTATEKEVAEIINYDSKFATDAKTICDFINEVSRNKETSMAVKKKSKFPTANWVHTFETFRDISDVIRTETLSGIPLEIIAFKKLLSRELIEMLKSSLKKINGHNVYSPKEFIYNFLKEHTFDLKLNTIELTAKRWDTLLVCTILFLNTKVLRTQVLDRAVESPFFLKFNAKLNQFEEEPVYRAICQLKKEIHSLSELDRTDVLGIISNENILRNTDKVRINTFKLLMLISLMKNWVNIIQLSAAILKHLEGAIFKMPFIFSGSPIEGENKGLEKERVTDSDVAKFLMNF